MSYQVLARKWRPRSFEEMVGQPHVVRALSNALRDQRLHHAYLFTGTRGVGKTTVARVLAKCLNCETGVTATPCGQCSACREIDEGRFIDLIEVDAASRTKVEDTRELLDNVQYAPTRGRYKVYLIDEVHMLSTHSFNALLKTLEEPPPHVKFLLATTDPQKLPVTILSRCLQFSLKAMPADMVGAHLKKVLEQEGVDFDPPAIMRLARAASGSMRDALSLLDQAIAYGSGALRDDDVREMLGAISQDHLERMLQALAAGDGPALMGAVDDLAQRAPDYNAVLGELVSLLHQVALAQQLPEALDEGAVDVAAVQALARSLAAEDVQLYYQIALLARRDLPLAPDPRAGFEMALLRMLAFRPAGAGEAATASSVRSRPAPAPRSETQARAPVEHARSATTPEPAPAVREPRVPEPAASRPAPAPAPTPASTAAPGGLDWVATVAAMGLGGPVLNLANHCAVGRYADGELVLTLASRHETLKSSNSERRLIEAVRQHLGEDLKVRIEIGEPAAETPAQSQVRASEERQRAAEAAVAGDELTARLGEVFGAQVVPGSVKPV
ncbi:DNA polymerase III subunit gamma/tau [Thioalkalivibrio sulfidiphilus]|uniref:DNA polymerase III subunit gamma/tau n=1 Tax=Thioalkalivibrio sulfidiphilus TaxID=1033854 RepID=UPI003B2BABE3